MGEESKRTAFLKSESISYGTYEEAHSAREKLGADTADVRYRVLYRSRTGSWDLVTKRKAEVKS